MSESNTMQASAYTSQGTAREKVALPESLFDGTVNSPVMHHAVKAFLANQRQGTHSTKTRGLVTGGNQKPWKQKGTGRARQGSTRAPHWPGGGTAFGPSPRSYNQEVPRKVKLLARKSAFNARARENSLIVIDAFDFEAPQTSRIRNLLDTLQIGTRNVLILTDGVKKNVYLSGRNISNVQVMPFEEASTYHLLWAHMVLVEAPAIGHTLEPVKESAPAPRRAAPKAKAAPRAESKGTTKAAPKKRSSAAVKSVAKKTSAKKAAAKKTAARAKPAAKKAAAKPRRKEK